MLNVYIIFGYPGTGKTSLSKRLSKYLDAHIYSVDEYKAIPAIKNTNLNNEYYKKLKNNKFGRIYYSFLSHINSIDTEEVSSIIIDAPLIDKERRHALFEVLSKFQIQNLFLFQLQCSDIKQWNNRLLNKESDIELNIYKNYRERFKAIEKSELRLLKYNCMVTYNIDTSQNYAHQILFLEGAQSLDLINDILNEKAMEKIEELDIENYKMITTYISDINKKIDVYINLNLTLFIAVITFIISNLPDPFIKFAFIPLTLINWISYKYFNANNRLLVTMQSHLANTYERNLEHGWYIKSLQFRESKPNEEKKKKSFSPINFYGFLIAFSVAAYVTLFIFELIKNKTRIIIDSSLPIDYSLVFNFTVTTLFVVLSIYAFVKIINYPDWPSLFKEKHERFKGLKKNKA